MAKDIKKDDIPQDVKEEIKKDIKKEIKKEDNKKKANGCLIALIVVLLFIGLLVGGAYWGYKRVMKAFEPKELGITYSEQDYDSFMENIGLEADPSVLCIDCPTPSFSEPHEVSTTVTNEQASAAFEYVNQHLSNASISDTQIKMNDGTAEMTTTLEFQGKTFPIYMTGTIEKASEHSISADIYDLKAGGISVPENIKTMVKEGLVNIANEKIASAGDNIRIDSIEITESGLNFDGLIPGRAE